MSLKVLSSASAVAAEPGSVRLIASKSQGQKWYHSDRIIKQMSGAILGKSKAMIPLRLFILYVLIVPFFVLRVAMSIVFFVCTVGVTTSFFLIASGPTAYFVQSSYRPAMEWAQDNDTFQEVWDKLAETVAFSVNLTLFVFRLTNEIWNGFCPLLDLVVRIVYNFLKQIATLFVTLPFPRYIVYWAIRFFALTWVEAVNLLVAVLNVFFFAAEELYAEIESITSKSFRRSVDDAFDTIEILGEIMLAVSTMIFNLCCKIAAALIETFGPLVVTFFVDILPVVLDMVPIFTDVIMWVIDLLTSEPMERLMSLLLQAVPLLIDVAINLVCGFLIYGASAACLVLYVTCVSLSFWLKYYVRPLLCFMFAFYAGCSAPFVGSMLNQRTCYGCGDYRTECSCSKKANAQEEDCNPETCNPVVEMNFPDIDELGKRGEPASESPSGPVLNSQVETSGDGDNVGVSGISFSARRMFSDSSFHRLSLTNATFFSSGSVYTHPSVHFDNGETQLIVGTQSNVTVDSHLIHANLQDHISALWSPHAEQQDSWFGVVFAQSSFVKGIKLVWKDNTVRGYTVSKSSPTQTTNTARTFDCYTFDQHTELDGQVANIVRVEHIQQCEGPVMLRQVVVYGEVCTGCTVRPVEKRSVVQVSELKNSAMWDPCASNHPIQLTDNRMDLSTFFVQKDSSKPMSVKLSTKLRHMPLYVVIHFAALAKDTKMQACIAGSCVESEQDVHRVWPSRGLHAFFKFDSSMLHNVSDGILSLSYSTSDQKLTDLKCVDVDAKICASKNVLHTDTWQNAALDLGISADHEFKYEWVHNTPTFDGKTTPRHAQPRCEVSHAVQMEQVGVADEHIAKHKDPFEYTPKGWLGISEIDIIVDTSLPLLSSSEFESDYLEHEISEVEMQMYHLDMLEFDHGLKLSRKPASVELEHKLTQAMRVVQMHHYETAGSYSQHRSLRNELTESLSSLKETVRHSSFEGLDVTQRLRCHNTSEGLLDCEMVTKPLLADESLADSKQLSDTLHKVVVNAPDVVNAQAVNEIKQASKVMAKEVNQG